MGAGAGFAYGQGIAAGLGQIPGKTAPPAVDFEAGNRGHCHGVIGDHTAGHAIEFAEGLIEAGEVKRRPCSGEIQATAVGQHIDRARPQRALGDQGRAAIGVIGVGQDQGPSAGLGEAAWAAAFSQYAGQGQRPGATNAGVRV